MSNLSFPRIVVPPETIADWQTIANLLAELAHVPAALIMRHTHPDIEVFVSSESQGNPYRSGEKEKLFGSGLYCEQVIKTQDKLLVPDALHDEHWRTNPDVKLGMISYLGFPILLPEQQPFGTLCVLDSKRNAYSDTVEALMRHFRDLIESHLALIYLNQCLGERNSRLSDYLMELQALRGLVNICSNCKRIRDSENVWHPIEDYLIRHPHADFSHSLCPECAERLYPGLDRGE